MLLPVFHSYTLPLLFLTLISYSYFTLIYIPTSITTVLPHLSLSLSLSLGISGNLIYTRKVVQRIPSSKVAFYWMHDPGHILMIISISSDEDTTSTLGRGSIRANFEASFNSLFGHAHLYLNFKSPTLLLSLSLPLCPLCVSVLVLSKVCHLSGCGRTKERERERGSNRSPMTKVLARRFLLSTR